LRTSLLALKRFLHHAAAPHAYHVATATAVVPSGGARHGTWTYTQRSYTSVRCGSAWVGMPSCNAKRRGVPRLRHTACLSHPSLLRCCLCAPIPSTPFYLHLCVRVRLRRLRLVTTFADLHLPDACCGALFLLCLSGVCGIYLPYTFPARTCRCCQTSVLLAFAR